MWHASIAAHGIIVPRIYLLRLALEQLRGVGDPSLGEWQEMGERAFHVRRRLSAREADAVGPVIDVRGTPEALARIEAARGQPASRAVVVDRVSSKRHLRKRACDSKKAYPTPELAARAIPGRGAHAYRCPFGPHFHVGRVTYDQAMLATAKRIRANGNRTYNDALWKRREPPQ